MISCSTLGISWSFAREPIKEVEASSRMKSGWIEADIVAPVNPELDIDMELVEVPNGGGISSVSYVACQQVTWAMSAYPLTVALNRTSARAKLTGMMPNFGFGKLSRTFVSMPSETWSE
jgi:hypothetical protein